MECGRASLPGRREFLLSQRAAGVGRQGKTTGGKAAGGAAAETTTAEVAEDKTAGEAPAETTAVEVAEAIAARGAAAETTGATAAEAAGAKTAGGAIIVPMNCPPSPSNKQNRRICAGRPAKVSANVGAVAP